MTTPATIQEEDRVFGWWAEHGKQTCADLEAHLVCINSHLYMAVMDTAKHQDRLIELPCMSYTMIVCLSQIVNLDDSSTEVDGLFFIGRVPTRWQETFPDNVKAIYVGGE